MSKKPLQNRLDNLFKTLEDIETGQDARFEPAPVRGWHWECSSDGEYLNCSPEISEYLGLPPDAFNGQNVSAFQVAPNSSAALRAVLQSGQPPAETEVIFLSSQNQPVNARFTLLARVAKNGHAARMQGFVQILPHNAAEVQPDAAGQPTAPAVIEPPQSAEPTAQPVESKPPKPARAQQQRKVATGALSINGMAIEGDQLRPSSQVWTKAAEQSLSTRQAVTQPSGEDQPAVIAIPLNLRERGGIVEIVDDFKRRKWTEEDHQFVVEVTNQLALALENAELYQTVQLELSERSRAEQEVRERNQNLATINIAGQELSRMTSAEEIFNLVATVAGQLVRSDVIRIARYDAANRSVSYPVITTGDQSSASEAAPLANDVAGYLFWTRKALLITRNLESEFVEKGISLPDQPPVSLLAVPMLAGDRAVGAILLESHSKESPFSNIHIELLSALATQATISLENAGLFQEIRAALAAIENRERYQANVALVAATLSKYGSKSLSEVLESLGQAAQVKRVYYAEARESDDMTNHWQVAAEWNAPDSPAMFDLEKPRQIPSAELSFVRVQLRETGWYAAGVATLPPPDRDFFAGHGAGSLLTLSVVGRGNMPGFIAFEQTESKREWQQDEIRLLQVAADALSNTILRENLLKQVQTSLRDTENLYALSHNLALATDMDEMLARVASGLHLPEEVQFVLVGFDYAANGSLQTMSVSAAQGVNAPQIGSEYPLEFYQQAFNLRAATYHDDVHSAALPEATRSIWLRQNIHAIALFPLWVGKRQTGVLYAAAPEKNAFTEAFKRYAAALVDQLATSVENNRLFEETQQALSETGLLYRISDAISQAATPQELATLVAENLMPENAQRVSLLRAYQSASGELSEVEVVGYYDSTGEYQRTGLRLGVEQLPLLRQIKSDPLVINDVRNSDYDAVTKKTLAQMKIAGGCVFPMRSAGKLVGLLLISANKPITFMEEEFQRLQMATVGMAVALEKQNLLREAQRRALELQTAAEIARDTSSTLSLDELLSGIVPTMCERFNFYHASIFLLDADQKYAVVRESTGAAGRDMKARGHKLAVGSKSIIGTVTATGEPLVINDTASSALHYTNPLLPETRAEMGIPLKLGTQVIGALDIQSRYANIFTEDDVSVLQILADQIAIAIENARAYQISQRAVEEMREVDRMKSQFLANMSHELRTPLNSIIGFSRVILKGIDGPINDVQTQDLSAIYNSGQHLLSLINNILDLSKIEAGKMELSFSDVHIGELVDSVMSTATGLVKGKPVRLNKLIPEGLPPARADNTRVRQVLLNFVSNAAKFTEEGEITVEAKVQFGPKGKPEIILTVTDSGPGIAPEDVHKLFQPFSQVDDSPTRKTGGTGLGLSICRSLVDMHGGRVGLLRSEVGVGSTFFFTLPLTDAYEPVVEVAPTQSGSIKILAIDDDPQIIGLYERYLSPHGYQVIGVTDPKQAVEQACALQPAAITLDVMMPEKDGWHVMHELKSNLETRNIPVVFCSIIDQEEKAYSLGAADYLIKPFVQEDLVHAIQRINAQGKIHRVLVVDDSPDDLRLVQKMLDDTDMQVILAEGGQTGWETLQSNPPDALVLDLFMPDLNGFEILARLRSDPLLQSLPVIVLTGADLTPEQRVQMIELGQKFLPKARLSETELVSALEQALQNYHLGAETTPEA